MPNQVTGIVTLSVNGNKQRSEINATLDFGGKERSPAVGTKVYGFSEKIVPSKVSFTIFHMSDTDLISLKDLVGASISFACDSGPVYPVSNAFVAKTIELSGGEGKVKVEMLGDPVDTKQ
jgi:hypothetical protein